VTNRLQIALSCLLVGLLTGCLEFERQSLSFRHDSATDTLFIFQDYQGIFGAEDPARLTEAEREQMASVMQQERTFFFGNWITEYNRKLFTEKQQTPKGELDADEAYEASLRALLDVALANIKVENVGFYLNRENRLCGAQRVTVKNVSKVVAALNHSLRFIVQHEGNKWDKTKVTRRLLHAFAESGQDALRLQGNRLEVRWPATEEDYRRFKDWTPQGSAFREAGGEMNYTNGVIILALGKPESKSASLTLPVSDRPYSGNSLVEAKRYGVKESFDALVSARAFLEGPSSAAPGRK
jgi:hypothetical protein